MKDPQIISISGENKDAVLAIWDDYVVDNNPDDSQRPMSKTVSNISIFIDLWDLTANAAITLHVGGPDMILVFDPGSKFWRIPCSKGTTLGNALTDRHKYVARISDAAGHSEYGDPLGAGHMREFYLEEFAVDNNSFEQMLARLPYEVKIGAPQSYIIWYDSDANIGNLSHALFKAPVYEGGIGTTSATDASRVTHRGAIIPY